MNRCDCGAPEGEEHAPTCMVLLARTMPPPPLPTGASGEHPAVATYQVAIETLAENTDEFSKLNERLARATTPAPKDARRDGGSDPPVDIVEEEALGLSSKPHEKKP